MTPAKYIEVTADALLITGPGRLCAVILTPAAAASTIILYDNTAASGSIVLTLVAVANGQSVTFTPAEPISFSKGLYADITGASAVAYVSLV